MSYDHKERESENRSYQSAVVIGTNLADHKTIKSELVFADFSYFLSSAEIPLLSEIDNAVSSTIRTQERTKKWRSPDSRNSVVAFCSRHTPCAHSSSLSRRKLIRHKHIFLPAVMLYFSVRSLKNLPSLLVTAHLIFLASFVAICKTETKYWCIRSM